jgi:hypothetical protein
MDRSRRACCFAGATRAAASVGQEYMTARRKQARVYSGMEPWCPTVSEGPGLEAKIPALSSSLRLSQYGVVLRAHGVELLA